MEAPRTLNDDDASAQIAPVLVETDIGLSDRTPEQRAENGRALLREIVETVALFAVIFTLARLTIGNYSILGKSMEPNYYQDERLLVDRVSPRLGFLQRGDIVIAHSPREVETELIKRLIGKPGDEIELRENTVFVNGTALTEPYLPPGADSGPRDATQTKWTLGENEYFLLGDNRSQSQDSRSFGTVQSTNIVGRALIIYYPFDRFQFVQHHDYP
jgi:signal peptidase I